MGLRRVFHGRICKHCRRVQYGYPSFFSAAGKVRSSFFRAPVSRPLWFLAKMYALILTVIWVRWTFPRTQFYGLLNLSWKILIPISLFTLLLTGAVMKLPLALHHLF